jgi:hypothetical protein
MMNLIGDHADGGVPWQKHAFPLLLNKLSAMGSTLKGSEVTENV